MFSSIEGLSTYTLQNLYWSCCLQSFLTEWWHFLKFCSPHLRTWHRRMESLSWAARCLYNFLITVDDMNNTLCYKQWCCLNGTLKQCECLCIDASLKFSAIVSRFQLWPLKICRWTVYSDPHFRSPPIIMNNEGYYNFKFLSLYIFINVVNLVHVLYLYDCRIVNSTVDSWYDYALSLQNKFLALLKMDGIVEI